MLSPPAMASHGGGLDLRNDLRNLTEAPDLPPLPGGREVEVPPLVDNTVGEVRQTVGGVADSVLPGGAPPPIGEPPPPGDPGTPTGPGTDPPEEQGPAGTERSGRSRERAGAGDGGPGEAAPPGPGGSFADGPGRIDLVASPAPDRPDEPTAAGLPGRLFEALKALPTGILVAMVGMAALGLAMAGRSAWLSTLASKLRRKALELSNDVEFLQDALLPPIPARIGSLDLSVAYRAADGPAAGGDFHDIVPLDDGRVGILVGDVSGHGREALGATALVHYTLRAHLEAGARPCDVVRLTDRALSGKLRMHYATVLVGIYDDATSILDYATAGHPAPLIRGEARDHAVQGLTPPIGLGPRAGLRETRVSIEAGGVICFFTDGLIEARDTGGQQVQREGLASLLDRLGDKEEAAALLDRLPSGDRGRDDLTLCVLRPGEARGDGTVVEEIEIGSAESLRPLGEFLGRCGLSPPEVSELIEEIHRRRLHGGESLLRIGRTLSSTTWTVGEAESDYPSPLAKRTRQRARPRTSAATAS